MFSRRILDTTVNLFKNQNRMSMIAIERIIANNKVAEESLALLKREVSLYFTIYFLFSSNVLTF